MFWCFWVVMLEKTLESPLGCKKIKPVNSKGNQSWIFIGRTDAEAEAPILWPPDVKSQFIRRDLNAEKRRRMLKAGGEWDNTGPDGCMSSPTEWTWVWASSRRLWRTRKPGVLQSMGCKESDMTERLNNKILPCSKTESPNVFQRCYTWQEKIILKQGQK